MTTQEEGSGPGMTPRALETGSMEFHQGQGRGPRNPWDEKFSPNAPPPSHLRYHWPAGVCLGGGQPLNAQLGHWYPQTLFFGLTPPSLSRDEPPSGNQGWIPQFHILLISRSSYSCLNKQ